MKTWFMVAALLVAAPLAAVADNGMDAIIPSTSLTQEDLVNRSLGVSIGFQDLLALAPSFSPTPSFSGTTSGAALTFGATYRNRFGGTSPWYFEVGGGWGTGGAKYEDNGPIPFEQKESLTTYYGNAGLGYIQMINRKVSFYGAGRLFYSSTTAKWEDDTDEYESEAFNVYGFEPAIGCNHRMGKGWSMYGEFYNQYGWGSGEVGDESFNTNVKYGCWRGGALFHF